MIQNRDLSSVRTKFVQIVCGFVLFGAGCLAVNGLMYGSFSKAGIVVALLVGLATVLLLDDRYWLLLPALSIVDLKIPGLPFSGIEWGCLFVTATHFVRLVLRQDSQPVSSFRVWVTVPLFLWICFMFMLNPVGVAFFGSRTVGGRFYIDVALGFMTFLSLSSLSIKEKDAKILFYTILFSLLISVSRGVLFPHADPDALVYSNTGLEQEASARYAFIGCSTIFVLLFAKWSIRQVFSSPLRIAVLFLLAVLVVYSGKRQAFGMVVLVPFFRVILKGRDVVLTCAMGVLAALVLAFSVAGDGVLFTLPQSAKRALAVVAPRYERETAGGIHDLFRQEIRKQAYDLIGENPLFGRQGFAMNLEYTRWMHFGGGYTGLYASHAYAGNWHNMWLAYACDFGLLGLALAICFWLWLVRFIILSNRAIVAGEYLPACVLFFSYALLESLVFSWVAGHASVSTYETWLRYGMLLALVNGDHDSFRQETERPFLSGGVFEEDRTAFQIAGPPSEGRP